MCTQTNVDTMLKAPQTPHYTVRRTHRTYTPEFKAELVASEITFESLMKTPDMKRPCAVTGTGQG